MSTTETVFGWPQAVTLCVMTICVFGCFAWMIWNDRDK